jgi:hypothetical protein
MSEMPFNFPNRITRARYPLWVVLVKEFVFFLTVSPSPGDSAVHQTARGRHDIQLMQGQAGSALPEFW